VGFWLPTARQRRWQLKQLGRRHQLTAAQMHVLTLMGCHPRRRLMAVQTKAMMAAQRQQQRQQKHSHLQRA
jgi:hypothetical protein